MVVMFCGHSEIPAGADIQAKLSCEIERLISQGAALFYHGGYGQFDELAATTVWKMKKDYPNIESVLVLPYLDKKVDTSKYDCTTYPPLESVPRRYAISHRNRWLVNHADVVVAYVLHSWGGAAKTLEYAQRRGKRIINLADLQS